MAIPGRSPRYLLQAPFQRRHWRALRGYLTVVRPGFPALVRYLDRRGEYPWTVTVRTPIGRFPITLHSTHDLLTVNEVFCRRDYGDGAGRVFVDVGANIGISALFFLTRAADTRVYCFEPVPTNVDRLRRTLAGFEDRFVVEQVAVTVQNGPARFWTEPTGRYGEIHDDGDLEVHGVAIVDALERMLAREGRIDLVKIDIEGREGEIVRAIPEELQVRDIVWESDGVVRWQRDRR